MRRGLLVCVHESGEAGEAEQEEQAEDALAAVDVASLRR